MIEQRELGKRGPKVGSLGYGAMVLEGYYGSSADAGGRGAGEAGVSGAASTGAGTGGEDTIRRALDLGMNMIDTADTYGNGENERRVGRAVKHRRNDAFIATKFGVVFEEGQQGTDFPTGWGFSLKLSGTPAYARKSLHGSLERLEVDHVDLWYLHYPDPATPVEESVAAMAEGVKAGQVRYLGLSNVTAQQVRRAHAIHPICAVQYEYSLWRREAETELLPTLRELGIALVAWSPLGNGFLTGTVDTLAQDDFRRQMPRFSGDNLQLNRDRFAPFNAIARELGVTPAQLALAWMLHQGPDVIPIPGTRRGARVEENARADALKLDAGVLRRIGELAHPGLAQGANLLR